MHEIIVFSVLSGLDVIINCYGIKGHTTILNKEKNDSAEYEYMSKNKEDKIKEGKIKEDKIKEGKIKKR